MPRRPALADLQGAARLAAEATAGLADLAEAMHARIAGVPGRMAHPSGRTRGVTGLVYKSVRGVTRLVGGSVDALLGLVGGALEPVEAGPERDAFVAALNGVLGDHLAASANPLATPMSLRHGGRALTLEKAALRWTARSVATPIRRAASRLHPGASGSPTTWATSSCCTAPR